MIEIRMQHSKKMVEAGYSNRIFPDRIKKESTKMGAEKRIQ